MKFKKMDEKDWVDIGNQVKDVRKELFKLVSMSSGKKRR